MRFLLKLYLTAGLLVAVIGTSVASGFLENEQPAISITPKAGLQDLKMRYRVGKIAFAAPESFNQNATLLSQKNALLLPDTISEFRKPPITEIDRSGRSELITASMIYSLLYYGWAVPTALKAEGGRPYVASYMLLGGGSFFVPFLLTREGQITEGMARGFAGGAGLGIAHGWALSLAVKGKDLEPETGLGLSVATSLAEGIYAFSYARKHNYSFGHMNILSNGGLWGGLLIAPIPFYFNSDNVRPYAMASLVGSGLGFWAADRLTKKINIADGDAQIISTCGLVGSFLGLATASSVYPDDFDKGTLAILMGGAATGLGLGVLKVKNREYSETDANLAFLGAFAGGLVGLGTVYVAVDNAEGNTYLWGSSIGGLAGFLLTDKIIKHKPDSRVGSLQLQFNPVALGQLLKPTQTNQAKQSPFYQASLVNARFRF